MLKFARAARFKRRITFTVTFLRRKSPACSRVVQALVQVYLPYQSGDFSATATARCAIQIIFFLLDVAERQS